MGFAVPEHRERESCFGDEDVAGHELERLTSGVGRVLVIARGDDAEPFVLDRDLSRTEDVAGRMKLTRTPLSSTVSPYRIACAVPAKSSPKRSFISSIVSRVASTAS
jgi:hypothetical protein